ncbi:MAG: PrsW family intramembrane metalloprotease [Ruminiclostridium sp.]|nr:PrsW family intramembrane metalloprotease [Ruminiclostridium sp.]
MEQIAVILYVCIALPMLPMLFILPDKRSRLFLGYLIIGCTICLIAGEVNVWLLRLFGGDTAYVTSTITPISEELMKAVPVLYFAVVFSDDRDTLLSVSFALGIGFAVLENAVILTQNFATISFEWAITRVIGAALMHGACTSAVGLGMSYIRKRRKLFFCGTFALLTAAIIYHASFNVLVQSSFRVAALILPAALYIPVLVSALIRRRKQKQ